jgi:hypothetical protein
MNVLIFCSIARKKTFVSNESISTKEDSLKSMDSYKQLLQQHQDRSPSESSFEAKSEGSCLSNLSAKQY